MLRRRILIVAVLALAVVAGLTVLYFGNRSRQATNNEYSCCGHLKEFRGMLVRCLEEGNAPISDAASRRVGGLSAFEALRNHRAILGKAYACPTYVAEHDEGAAFECYRMPDWTHDQWMIFAETTEADPQPVFRPNIPAIWDAEPNHFGCRNVAFLDGSVRMRVPEEKFQALRAAAEAAIDNASRSKPPS